MDILKDKFQKVHEYTHDHPYNLYFRDTKYHGFLKCDVQQLKDQDETRGK